MWMKKDYGDDGGYSVWCDHFGSVKVEHEGGCYVMKNCDAIESIRNAPVRANEAICLYVSTQDNETLREACRGVIDVYTQEHVRDTRWRRANSSINPHINRRNVLNTSPEIVIPEKTGDDVVDRLIGEAEKFIDSRMGLPHML